MLRTLVLLLAIVVPLTATGAETQFEQAVGRARVQAAHRLVTLGKRATRKRETRLRWESLRNALTLVPDNKAAHKALGYVWLKKEKRWDRSSTLDTLERSQSKLQRTEGEEKRVEILTKYRDAVFRAMKMHADAPKDQINKFMTELSALLPGDPEIGRRLGKIQFEGIWVLIETRDGILRRRALRTRGERLEEKLRRAVRPAGQPTEAAWTRGWKTDRYRVVGTVSSDVLKSACVLSGVAEGICDELLGPADRTRGFPRAIILTGTDEAVAVAKQEGWKAKIPLIRRHAGYPVSNRDKLLYHADVDDSRMACPRDVISGGLRLRIDDSTPPRGWIVEGIGQRLCWYATGQHGPPYYFVGQTSGQGDRQFEPVPRDADQWPVAAARVLEKRGVEVLVGVLTMTLNAMKSEDVLVAYGLATFLIEVRPEQWIAFAKASAQRHDIDAYVKSILGFADAAALAKHLQSWLAEYGRT